MLNKIILGCFLSLLSISAIIEIVIPYSSLFQNAQAASPSFSRREAAGNSHNLFDIWNNQTVNDPSYIDIKSVNYFSDGRHLNATIWLDSFEPIPPAEHDNVNYGMYFDADFNSSTGVKGIDYKAEISWDKKNQTWTRVFEEWGTNTTSPKTLSKELAKNFFENGSSYVTLSADLDLMISPDRYRVAFYAETLDGGFTSIVDGTDWVSIPPSEYTLSISPSPLRLRQNDPSTVEVMINSSTNNGLSIKLWPKELAEDNNVDKDFSLPGPKELHVSPPNNFASAHLQIGALPSAKEATHTIELVADITAAADPINAIEYLPGTDENIREESLFQVQVERWGPFEEFNALTKDVFTPIAAFIAAISGIITGILGWIYGIRQKRQK